MRQMTSEATKWTNKNSKHIRKADTVSGRPITSKLDRLKKINSDKVADDICQKLGWC